MFVAWRDLRFAKGRFALIGAVVALLTLLVGFLSGLTAGLADQNISAITSLPASRIVFSDPASDTSASYSDSAVTSAQLASWSSQPGVTAVSPLGITQGKATRGNAQSAVGLFGAPSGFASGIPAESGHISLPQTAAAGLNAAIGQTVSIAGRSFVVDSIIDDTWYSHTPVAWVSLSDWQATAASLGSVNPYATVFAVAGDNIAAAAADSAAGTTSTTVISSLLALSAFRSEIGSLAMIVVMLFGISALVVGAFFTVWGMQRQPDVAILKALGAANRMLVRDSLGEAAVVLVSGVAIGIGLTAAMGGALGTALPFILSPLTTVLPGLLMVIVGLAGSAFALRSVTHANPLNALGSNR